jgi:tRNA G18 (ribose-2'-O)-methylase SpoU
VPFARLERWPDGLTVLKENGLTVVALTPHGDAVTIDEFAARSLPERIAILVGAEGAGLSASAEALADRRVRIPISARVDSLNLAVATGIALSRLSAGRPL